MPPGVVIVWRRGEPCCIGRRIDGLISLVGDGIELQAERILATGEIQLTGTMTIDRQSRDLVSVQRMPAIVSTIDGVAVVVGEVTPFENVTPRRAGKLVIGGSLAPTVRAIEDAANAEEHISIKGPQAIVRELALHYAAKLGVHAWFRPSGDQHLDHVLATRENVRTIILELSRPLFDLDVDTINRVLETDLRFVVVRYDDHYMKWVPPALAFKPLVVPNFRFDELPFAILDRVRQHSADAIVEPGAIAALLEIGRRVGEDALFSDLERAIHNWEDRGGPTLRAGDVPRGVA